MTLQDEIFALLEDIKGTDERIDAAIAHVEKMITAEFNALAADVLEAEREINGR